ncbi:MAG: pilus assembly protein TadG-related protein [Actinomycetes bacterium]
MRRDDRGTVAVIVAVLIVPVLLGSAAMGIDVSLWHLTGQRMQRAADAAALAGVTYLPGNPTRADEVAQQAAAENGYRTVGPTAVTSAAVPGKPTQLRVTIVTTVRNAFGGFIGKPEQQLTRTAVADYAGPVPMGSPCNSFGNQPPGGTARDADSVTTCAESPQLWANIAGPASPKSTGDAFTTRGCATGDSGCVGSTNTDYDPRGQFYRVSVTPDAHGNLPSSIELQVFDPVMVEVGDRCDRNLPATFAVDRPNPWSAIAGDAAQRYVKGATSAFCTGDHEYDTDASKAVTTFAVRAPSAAADPLASPLVTNCTRQYRGYPNTLDLSALLNSGKPGYDPVLAQNFRQWSSLCTLSAPAAGDYYLQVKSNVAFGSASTANLNSLTESPPLLHWAGHNRYALRAKVIGNPDAVSIAGAGRVTVYANAPGSKAEFYLARVGSGSAGRRLTLSLFDAGDADRAGTITILPPTGSDVSPPGFAPACQGWGSVVGSPAAPSDLSECALPNVSVSTGWNGKTQIVTMPIPANYTCNDRDPAACWFKIRFSYPGGTFDTTSWWSALGGDPVRIID